MINYSKPQITLMPYFLHFNIPKQIWVTIKSNNLIELHPIKITDHKLKMKNVLTYILIPNGNSPPCTFNYPHQHNFSPLIALATE